MPLPRPARPSVLWADIRAFTRQRPRHQWVAALLALLVPGCIVTSFYLDSQTNLTPRQTIIYVESWPADRSDEEIRAKQQADIARRKAAEEERRRQFQQWDEQLNRLGI